MKNVIIEKLGKTQLKGFKCSDVFLRKIFTAEEVENIEEITKKFNVRLSSRINLILDDITEEINCQCGKKLKLICGKYKNKFCSYPCRDIYTKEKKTNTIFERYGVVNVMQNDEIKQKHQKTCIERYGVKHHWENRDKINSTMIERYGVVNVMQNDEIKKRASLRKKEKTKEKYEKTILDDVWIKNNGSIQNIAEKLDLSPSYVANLISKNNMNYTSPKQTNIEKQIQDILVQHDISFEVNKRKLEGLEIDFFIPKFNIGIECNGNFWHSEENGKDRKYHLNKTRISEEKNIKLLHFWGSEIDEKFPIVESILSNLLKITKKKIFARKCHISEVSSAMARKFCDINHIQGFFGAKFHYGLFYEGEMVSYMSFCGSRYNKNHQWELIRFCNKLNTNVIGGASKLFKQFERNNQPKSIISYQDKRLFSGNLYQNLGFMKTGESPPSYFYTKHNTIKTFSRLEFQKHKLKNILPIFDDSLSEHENAHRNGFHRNWDCGNNVWVRNF